MLIILCIVFLIPLHLSFGISYQELINNSFLIFLCPIILILDILINLNTGFFDKGNSIVSRKEILKNFFKKNLFFDLICILPFIVNIFNYEMVYFNIRHSKKNDFLSFEENKGFSKN